MRGVARTAVAAAAVALAASDSVPAARPAPHPRNLVRCDGLGLGKLLHGAVPVMAKFDMPRDAMTPDVAARDAEWTRFAARLTATEIILADVSVSLGSPDPDDRALFTQFSIRSFGDIPQVHFYRPGAGGLRNFSATFSGVLTYKALLAFAAANGVTARAPAAPELRATKLNVVDADATALGKLAGGSRPLLVRVDGSPALDRQEDDGTAFFQLANSAMETDIVFANLSLPTGGGGDEAAQSVASTLGVRSFSQLPMYWAIPAKAPTGAGTSASALSWKEFAGGSGAVDVAALRSWTEQQLGIELPAAAWGGRLPHFERLISTATGDSCRAPGTSESCTGALEAAEALLAAAPPWQREAAGWYVDALRRLAPGGTVDGAAVAREQERLRQQLRSGWVGTAARRRAQRRLDALQAFSARADGG